MVQTAFRSASWVAFLLYGNAFFQPIQQLVQQYNCTAGQAAIPKITTFSHVRRGSRRPKPLPLSSRLVLTDVSFATPRGALLRSSVSTSRQGRRAFVGARGRESTIAKLVTPLLDPTVWKRDDHGHDRRDVTIIRCHATRVRPAEPSSSRNMRDTSFREARPDDDEIWEAVHRVGLTDLVDRLPEGLDTPVHERGVSLSSGERQLIALARAFLAGPRVLVLDEATSNLDLKSETLVEKGLDAVLEGRTAIIVAHRLSTAMRAEIRIPPACVPRTDSKPSAPSCPPSASKGRTR